MAFPKIDIKKALLIVLFILITLLFGYLLYITFFRAPAPVSPPTNINVPIGGIPGALPGVTPGVTPVTPPITVPGAGQPGITGIPTIPTIPTVPGAGFSTVANGGIVLPSSLVSRDVFAPVLAGNGSDVAYYDKANGTFYTIAKTGEKTLLSDRSFPNVETVTWSPNTQKAVLEYPDGSNIIYNFQTEEQVTLPKHWKDFDFSPDSNNIVFKDMKTDPENRWLSSTNDQGTDKVLIERLGEEDAAVHPTWAPHGEVAALFTESMDGGRAHVYFIGFHGENYKSAVVQGRDFRFTWSPGGKKLLYSVYNAESEYQPTLWVTNSQGDYIDTGRTNLNLNTWADKCTFGNGTTIYCAVPTQMEPNAGLNPAANDIFGDNLYRIDLETGAQTLIAEPLIPAPISAVLVSEDGKTLYYTDKRTGALNSIDL